MSDAIQLYPSGFFGCEVEVTAPLPPEIWDRTERWVGAVQRPNCIAAMKLVEDLWTAHVSGDPGVNSFDFAEAVLKAAKVAFGNWTLGNWLRLQMSSPFYGGYHQDWLEETVAYVLAPPDFSKKRQFTYNVWSGLIDTSKRCAAPGPSRLLYDRVFNLNAYDVMSMTEVIQQWVSKERGLQDLLESLHMLYGKRA